MGTGKTYSTKYLLDSNNNTGVAGQVLVTTATGVNWQDAESTGNNQTQGSLFDSKIVLIDTPNGGLKPYRVITDEYGEWIQVGRFAANAMTTVQSVWSSVSGLSTGTSQSETTEFSADFGDCFPDEVRIMGATDFNNWRNTRTIDFVYKVPAGRKWKFFFSNGETTGMGIVDAVKYGWTVNGAYDGFGRWTNPDLVSIRMSDTTNPIINTSAAYTTPTANAFNWETNSDAKFSVSATRTFCGQDTFVTSGVGNDDNIAGFFDEYPGETNNMQGGADFSSAVWVLIKIPGGASGGGGDDSYWSANGNDIHNDNSGNVGIGITSPTAKLHLFTSGSEAINLGIQNSERYYKIQTDGGFLTFNDVSAGDTARMVINSSGNVGIGTTDPSFQLSIENHATTTSTATLEIDGKRTNGTDGPVGEMIFSNNGDTFATVAGFRDAADNKGSLQFQTQDNTFATRMTISSEGKVGIGTTNPGTALQVGGLDDGSNYDITLGWNAVNTQAVGTKRSALTFKTSQTGVNNLDIYKWDIAMVTAPATASNEPFGSDLAFLRSTRNATSVDETTMILTQLGNVGIGTDSPNAKLDVQGTQGQLFSVTDDLSGDIFSVADISGVPIMNVNSSGLTTIDGTLTVRSTTTPQIVAEYNSSNKTSLRYDGVDTISGGDGVYSRGGVEKLRLTTEGVEVRGTSSSGNLPIAKVISTGSISYLKFFNSSTGTDASDGTYIGMNGGTAYLINKEAGNLYLGTGDAINLTLENGGNVGINTTNPIDKLNVNGGTGDAAAQQPKITVTRTSSTGNVLVGKMILTTKPSDPTNHGNLVFQVKTTASSGESTAYYTNAITIDGKNAKVGIGTASPDKTLTVGGVNPTEGINLKTKSGSNVWTIWSVEQYFSQEGYMRLYDDNVAKIQFRAGGDSFINGGNFGIGDTAPTSISSNTNSITVNSSRADLSGAYITKANGTVKNQMYWDTTGFRFDLSPSSGDFNFKVGNTDKVRISKEGNISTPNQELTATAIPTNKGIYTSEIRLIDTPNGGLKQCRVITDNYGEWILVGRFAADARANIQGIWSSETGLDTSTAQNNTTRFSADFGDSYPSEVRIMGATDFGRWRDTRTIDWVYGVPAGRKWKNFFSGGTDSGMALNVKYGWEINGAYDGFGRWVNPAQTFVRMSDTNVTNPSSAYTTATTNAFNWNAASDAKMTVSSFRAYSGQDTTETAGFGADDNVQGFFDVYPNETNNMQGGSALNSAVWVLIKLPTTLSSGGGSGTGNQWAGGPVDIHNTNTGNVGIGTDDPDAKLDIKTSTAPFTALKISNYGSNVNALYAGAVDDTYLFFGSGFYYNSSKFRAPSTAAAITSYNSGVFRVFTDSGLTANTDYVPSERIRVTSSGNVGIGVPNPNEKLQLAGNLNAYAPGGIDAGLFASTAAGSTTIGIRSNGITHFNGGNVGIGTTNPTTTLEVDGTINFNVAGDRGFFCNPGAGTFSLGDINDVAGGTYISGDGTNIDCYAQTVHISQLQDDGTLTVTGDMVAYGSPSDKRLKENIKPIESALDKAMKLQGVTFDWKENNSILDIKEDIGFIAQDVQKVVPELVRENSNGMLSMRHQGITPILLEAIKELKAEIEELKKQIK